jgi:hypothetical protein
MDADPHGQPDAFVLFQAGVQRPHDVEDAQASTDGPLGVVFVGLRVAKVHQQAIAQILGDIPVKALDDLDPSRLISQHHLAEVFRVELTGESCGLSAERRASRRSMACSRELCVSGR